MSKENEKTVKEVVNTVENTENASNDAAVEQPTEEVSKLCLLSAYHGLEADEVTRALLARPDFKNYGSLVITNVIDGSERYEGAITLVVNKALPQFVKDPQQQIFVEGSSKNIFVTRIQLSAILKGQGDPQLAELVANAPVRVLLALFVKARISVTGHLLANGEQFINPYASKMPTNVKTTDHDRYEYFPYELQLQAVDLARVQLALITASMGQAAGIF